MLSFPCILLLFYLSKIKSKSSTKKKNKRNLNSDCEWRRSFRIACTTYKEIISIRHINLISARWQNHVYCISCFSFSWIQLSSYHHGGIGGVYDPNYSCCTSNFKFRKDRYLMLCYSTIKKRPHVLEPKQPKSFDNSGHACY